jgi:Methyltransferase FkbM domain
MDVLQHGSRLAGVIAPALAAEPMSILDIGCAGGISSLWRRFEPNLRAIGFDPSLEECKRLQAGELNPNVSYVPGFVGAEPDNAFLKLCEGRNFCSRNPWGRLAVARTVELQESKRKAMSEKELTDIGAWHQTPLADPKKPIFINSYLKERRVDNIDFIKLDVDGPDFIILNSIGENLNKLGVLGLALEVNWFGSDHPADNTFHNVDRLMRKLGFELYDVSMRRYAHAALPSRYRYKYPAETLSGRPLQGDALYLRDLGSPDYQTAGSSEKVLKLATLFEMAGIRDGAAELLLKYRDNISSKTDVDLLLDLLAEEDSLALFGEKLSFREFTERFEKDDQAFYPE